jgi:K+-sensing histidine kinase KdpD
MYWESAVKKYWILMMSVMILLSITYFDYFTGEIGFFIFYFVPILLLSWHLGRWPGAIMSIASSLCWLLADYFCGVRYSNFAVAVWDTLVIRGGAFIIAAFAVAKLRESVDKERKTGKELRAAIGHLKQLKDILPICASCKNRMDCKCYLEQVDAYLKNHSDGTSLNGLNNLAVSCGQYQKSTAD